MWRESSRHSGRKGAMTTQDELLAEIKSTRAATKATESAMTAFECRLNVTLALWAAVIIGGVTAAVVPLK